MTEEEARAWVDARYGAAVVDRLTQFGAMVSDENNRQNLVAKSTLPTMWTRHLTDSAQLEALHRGDGRWLDVGTGGGFPGMVIALLRSAPIEMVEPRRRRADFLEYCVEHFGLTHARVTIGKVEGVEQYADVVSARAVASVDTLLTAASACTDAGTQWILPRGRITDRDVADLRHRWLGMFHVKQSVTDLMSSIIIAEQVSRR